MQNEIQVSIDKSHIVTIGEKLYGESLELIRELVSNSYDADANRVWIEIDEHQIKVKDDGTGMDEAGLREYFNIGSQNKKFSNVTNKYKRFKIGQFGIGKFAVLTACNRFKLFTQQNGYCAEVTFDKENWQKNERWSVPIETQTYNPTMGNGTIITLEKLKKNFSIPEVERFVRERLPINAPHFEIYINKKRVEPVYISGKHFAISMQTEYGFIQGEIIAPNFRQQVSNNKVGIETTVKGIMIKRETFELETEAVFAIYKLIGRISSDFLPITSDRSRFILDSPEYQLFFNLMRKEIKKIAKLLNEEADNRTKKKTDETLKDTMHRLGKAIRKNPAFSPKMMFPTGEIDETADNKNALAPESYDNNSHDIEALKLVFNDSAQPDQNMKDFTGEYNEDRQNKAKKVKIKNLAGKMMVARRIKIGGLGIVCNIESFGKEERPVFAEGGVIYINQDHPLYQKQSKKGKDNLSFYLAYLLSQQISLMVAENDPYEAFSIQNKLLADSF